MSKIDTLQEALVYGILQLQKKIRRHDSIANRGKVDPNKIVRA